MIQSRTKPEGPSTKNDQGVKERQTTQHLSPDVYARHVGNEKRDVLEEIDVSEAAGKWRDFGVPTTTVEEASQPRRRRRP